MLFNPAVFNGAVFNVAGGDTPPAVVVAEPAVGKPWKQKWRQQLVDALAEQPVVVQEPPRWVRRAIERVLEDAPPDDSAAILALRRELEKLNVVYRPQYGKVLKREYGGHWDLAKARRDQDDEDVLLLMLH